MSVSHTASDEVRAAIPHRDPFLFVDRVTARASDELTAVWRVPHDADWFRGHYPGQPILPGALSSEHVFQVAAILISNSVAGFKPAEGTPVLTKIEGARFRRMVRPGEVLETRVRVRERLGPAWYMSGTTRVDGAQVLNIRFVLALSAALAKVGE